MNENNIFSNDNYGINVDYQQNQNIENNKNPKKKKWVFWTFLVLLFVMIGISSFFIYQERFKSKENNIDKVENSDAELEEEVIPLKEYKNVIGNKNIIETTLDFKAILGDDSVYDEAPLSDYNLTKISFSKDKVYYSYSPYPSDLQDFLCTNIENVISKCELNQESNCKIKYAFTCSNVYEGSNYLFNKYVSSDSTEYDLDSRYLISSNIDGSNFEEIESYDSSTSVITFEHISEDNVYVFVDDGIYKIDKDNKISLVQKDSNIVEALSDNDTIVFLEGSYDSYYLAYYDAKTLKEKKRVAYTLSPDLELRIDSYNGSDLYNVINKDNKVNIYKNGKLQHTLTSYLSYSNIVVSKKYIYLFMNSRGILKIIKLNKNTYEQIEEKDIALQEDSYLLKYMQSYNGNFYFLAKHGLYEFNENKIEFKPVSSNYEESTYVNFYESGSYHNFIYYYYDNDLYIYNIVTNENLKIENVKYHYFNKLENRLYIVQLTNDGYELSYYEID